MLQGGFCAYGEVAGILMLDSKIPRLPGDPGHAQTFSFPVLHGIVVGLPFQDLVDANTDRVELAVETARKLESRGVSFVAADCGLFSVFQDQIARAISIPFIGSSLSLIPFLCSFLSPSFGIGVLTGDTGMLSELHLRAAGADPSRTLAIGMENSAEFKRVVIDRGEALDEPALAHDVRTAATALAARARSDGRRLGAVVIECTNLIPYRSEVQECVGVPVYDLVSLIELFAGGFAHRRFAETHRSFRSPR